MAVRETLRSNWGLASTCLVSIALIGVALVPDPPRPSPMAIREQAATPVPKGYTPEPQDWHEVARFASDRTGHTERFIVGTKWRLCWDARDDDFALLVYSDDGGMIDPGATGGSVLHRPGAYYLSVASTQPYVIIVEDWH